MARNLSNFRGQGLPAHCHHHWFYHSFQRRGYFEALLVQAPLFMKPPSTQFKDFAKALLGLSEEALLFSRHYVENSPKEKRNPNLALFFAHALSVVQEFQKQLQKTQRKKK